MRLEVQQEMSQAAVAGAPKRGIDHRDHQGYWMSCYSVSWGTTQLNPLYSVPHQDPNREDSPHSISSE
jgi:hypothetical protein